VLIVLGKIRGNMSKSYSIDLETGVITYGVDPDLPAEKSKVA
jgi:hypothetical protein